MSTHKYIYWRPEMINEEGKVYAIIHLLVGYNQASLSDFKEMADELRKTFPQATDDKITGGKVFKSSFVNNFTIISWGAYIPAGDYPGWFQKDSGTMDYCW